MSDDDQSAPAWLFSFVDLAFLMLIGMTQIGDDRGLELDFGEIIVPRIHAEGAVALPSDSEARWQLRIHPPEVPGDPPYELRLASGTETASTLAVPRIDALELQTRLAGLRADFAPKPLLAPHEDSRSQDLLDAVALVESFWPGRRRATVLPQLAQQ